MEEQPVATPLDLAIRGVQAAWAMLRGPGMRVGDEKIIAERQPWFAMADAVRALSYAAVPDQYEAEVREERARQDTQWGGPEHDDEHSLYGFAVLVCSRALKAMTEAVCLEDARCFCGAKGGQKAHLVSLRRRLLQTEALARAARQSIDRRIASAPSSAE